MNSADRVQDHLTPRQREYGTLCTALKRSAQAQCESCRYGPAVHIFSDHYGQVTVHGGFLRGFWGTYLTAQNTRGLLHISSLPVKGTSCHGTRIKTSPAFFFQCLVMKDPHELRMPPRSFSPDTALFFTHSAPSGLGITPHVLALDKPDHLSPSPTVSASAAGVVTRAWLRFAPQFLPAANVASLSLSPPGRDTVPATYRFIPFA